MQRKDAGAALLFLALSILMTWPLARLLPVAASDPGDPYLNAWILDWDQYATVHQPLRLFDANAFHPAKLALAFSENLYAVALLLVPFRLLGAGPLAAYNIGILLGFAFSGFGAYVLGRRLTGSAGAGIAAGIFYAFVPFRFTQLAHIQHVWGGWLPLLVAALLHYADGPSWRRAGLFGFLFLMNGLTNIHWLLFGGLAIASSVVLLFGAGVRRWIPWIAATAMAMLLLLPFLWPYQQAARQYGMVRQWSDLAAYSARPAHWLVSNGTNRLYAMLADSKLDPELWLFPGFLAIALSAAGAVIAARRDRRPLAIALLWLTIGFLGSLGSHFVFHRLLFDFVPGFRAIRVPARWAAIAYVGMAMLVAFATAALARRRAWIGAVVAIAFLIELRAAPVRWYLLPSGTPPVYDWLRDTTVRGGVLELPIHEDGSDYLYLLRATVHHKPLLNGTSGFSPPGYAKLDTLLHQVPIPETATDELRRMDCELLVVHSDAISPATRAWLVSELGLGRLRYVRHFDHGMLGDWVFSLRDDVPRLVPPELDAFANNKPVRGSHTFGFLDTPGPGSRMGSRPFFSGFAISANGVERVDILLANGKVRVPTQLLPEPPTAALFPWYPAERPRFIVAPAKRPEGVEEQTDVQVEIIDRRGVRTRLEDRWFTWPDPR
jgi:hypothetical protein